jgi:catechol 2,3-dioxygenase-like lactoylglutathione lyase family enzyme
MAIPLLHLGLLVHDQRRSLRFYETYFGFESAGARRYPDGWRVEAYWEVGHPPDRSAAAPAAAPQPPTGRGQRRC